MKKLILTIIILSSISLSHAQNANGFDGKGNDQVIDEITSSPEDLKSTSNESNKIHSFWNELLKSLSNSFKKDQ